MIVTTAGRTDEAYIQWSKNIAKELGIQYMNRKTDSIDDLHKKYQTDVLVVGKNRLQLFKQGMKEPFFFHPNSAMFRVKRLLKGQTDPLIEATKLEQGNTVLDCTLGLGSDSIVASFVAGDNGKVTGLEAHRIIAYIVKHGLQAWESGLPAIDAAMRRIQIVQADHFEYLKGLQDNSYDIIYFDPMFEEQIAESNGINELKAFASYSTLNQSIISEAKRVARKRIVLKDHFRSDRFDLLGFTVIKRPSAKFHFGYIDF